MNGWDIFWVIVMGIVFAFAMTFIGAYHRAQGKPDDWDFFN